MDDFYLIGTKEYLKDCLVKIEEYIKGLKLELNPKTQLCPIKRPVPWCGFSYKITNDKLIVRVANSKKLNAFKKYKAMVRNYVHGEITYKTLKDSWRSWVNFPARKRWAQ